MPGRDIDFLDEIIVISEEEQAGFAHAVDDALSRRVMGRTLSQVRLRLGLSQAALARKMGTSQPAVCRLENGADVRLSTLTRYMEAVGLPRNWPERLLAVD
ncbi:MAG: DNA-binding transcriptional regulator YiaG [Cognaticolwellia sp.]|jgi:DNA-binding transcriptional regulator YiaG